MKKSGYLAKRSQIEQGRLDAMQRTMKQYMLDSLLITMHVDFGWGYARCKQLEAKWSETFDAFFPAMQAGMESDVYQERLDRALREIVGENQEFYGFAERYPEVKRLGYETRR